MLLNPKSITNRINIYFTIVIIYIYIYIYIAYFFFNYFYAGTVYYITKLNNLIMFRIFLIN